MELNFPCKWNGCLFRAENSYSLSKHESRCRFKNIIHPSPLPSPQNSPSSSSHRQYDVEIENDVLLDVPIPPPIQLTTLLEDSSQTNVSLLINSLAISLCAFEQKVGAGAVNEVISILRNPDFSLTTFRNSIRSFQDCKSRTDEIVQDQLRFHNMEKTKVLDTSGTSYGFMYYKNPVNLLKEQIQLANENNCFFKPNQINNNDNTTQNTIEHPFHTLFTADLYQQLRDCIITSEQHDIFWNEDDNMGSTSFMGCLQLFTDKSKTSLKTTALVAYPVHLTFQNFTASFRRHCITRDLTILGYLPTTLFPIDDDDDEIVRTSTSTGRQTRLSILQNSLQSLLSPLANVASTGFLCVDSKNIARNCFPLITNYCCDIPEAKDVAAVIAGVNTLFPCHRCLIPRHQLGSVLPFSHRQATDRSTFQIPPKDISMISLYAQPSFLENSPLLPSAHSFNLYKIFRFEPLHNFHLGISKLLKTCIIHRLQSENLFTTAGSAQNTSRQFKSVQNSILRGINSLLATIQRDYFVPGLIIDFSTSEVGQHLNGLYLDRGLKGMLEGKHFKSLDMVFPFIGAFIDFCCDEIENAPLTTLFSMYSDILFTSIRQKQWTPLDLSLLRAKVSTFKFLFIDVFQQYHPSGLRTLKFHLLDHLVTDIAETGGLQHVDAGTFEYAHQSFKRHHRQTSRRHTTAMEETIKRMQYHKNLIRMNNSNQNQPSITQTSRNISTVDGAVLVRDGFTLNLMEFQHLVNSLSHLPQNSQHQVDVQDLHALKELTSENAFQLFEQLGYQASTAFLNLTREALDEKNSSCSPTLVHLTIVKSAYLVGGLIPTLSDFDFETKLIRYNSNYQRYIQRIFATKYFGPSGKPRYSFVTLDSDQERSVWIAKLSALVRIKPIDLDEPLECAFVQFMDSTHPKNNIETALDCICLRWSTDDLQDHTHNPIPFNSMQNVTVPAPWFGLVDASSIYSAIHVIRTNIPHFPFISKTHWMFHRFAINRFYYNREETEYTE